MSKRITVIKRQEHLPKPSYVLAMEEVTRQTARGAAIAATAYLDLLLREALELKMRPLPALQNLLFESRGPLQDFSARIQVAFALSVIGSGAYLDLGIMREIRNAFAHSADAFDFDREDIAAQCKRLWFPRHVRFANSEMPVAPREVFMRGVEMLADGLIEAELDAKKAKPPGSRPSSPPFIQLGPPWPPPQPPTKKPRARPSRKHPTG